MSLLLVVATVGIATPTGAQQESEPDVATDTELLARVSAAIRVQPRRPRLDEVAYLDLVHARRQLRLEPTEFPGPQGERAFRFAVIASDVLGWVGIPHRTRVGNAIDEGRIQAAAGLPLAATFDATVLRTTQPFSEIVSRLARHGYREVGRLLVGRQRRAGDFGHLVLGDAGGGVVVIAGSREVARAALDGKASALTVAATEVTGVSTPARAAARIHRSCIVASVAGQDLVPRTGVVGVRVRKRPLARRLAIAGKRFFGLRVGRARVEGPRVVAPLTYTSPNGPRPSNLLRPDSFQRRGHEKPTPLYRC